MWWTWNVLIGSILIGTIAANMVRAITEEIHNKFPVALFITLTLPFHAWVFVGTWRSARNHPGGWANVVYILLVISAVLNLIALVTLFMGAFTTGTF